MEELLRQQVRLRANYRCEYCGLSEEYSDAPFQLDHIIATKHGGPTTLENTAWSCLYCNSFKGPNIAGWNCSTKTVVRLFHPRHDTWHDHFSWAGPVLRGMSLIGQATIDVLRINDKDAVVLRQLIMQLSQTSDNFIT